MELSLTDTISAQPGHGEPLSLFVQSLPPGIPSLALFFIGHANGAPRRLAGNRFSLPAPTHVFFFHLGVFRGLRYTRVSVVDLR